MKGDIFKPGDEVAVSAAFLRSMGTHNFAKGNSGLSTNDPGIGEVIGCEGSELYVIWFKDVKRLLTYNAFNLVHRRDINKEAHRH